MNKQEVWTSEELKDHFEKKEKKPKYGQVRKEYNGVKYHSTKEANYAASLDLLIKAGTVTRWERQLSYSLGVNEKLITRYILDFKIWFKDGRIEHHDVKGYKKGVAYDLFTIKKKLMKAILYIDVYEV